MAGTLNVSNMIWKDNAELKTAWQKSQYLLAQRMVCNLIVGRNYAYLPYSHLPRRSWVLRNFCCTDAWMGERIWTSTHVYSCGSAQDCLASYLGHLLPVGLGIKGGLREQGRVLLRGYPQLVVEWVVPDLFGTKVKWAQQIPSGLESSDWHAHAGGMWHHVLRMGWIWRELSAPGVSDWTWAVIFLLSRPQTGLRPGASRLSVLIISIWLCLLFTLPPHPCSVPWDGAEAGPVRLLVFLVFWLLTVFGWWKIPARDWRVGGGREVRVFLLAVAWPSMSIAPAAWPFFQGSSSHEF